MVAHKTGGRSIKSLKYPIVFVLVVIVGMAFLFRGNTQEENIKSENSLDSAMSERISKLNRRVVSKSSIPFHVIDNSVEVSAKDAEKDKIVENGVENAAAAWEQESILVSQGRSPALEGKREVKSQPSIESSKKDKLDGRHKSAGGSPKLTHIKAILQPRNASTEKTLRKWKKFQLGPRFPGWDRSRAKYKQKHPSRTRNRHGAPLAMMVTATDQTACHSAMGDHLLLKLMKNKQDYARRKDMRFFWQQGLLRSDFDASWGKYPLLRSLMLSHPQVEWFWWIDSDAMITDMAFDIPWARYRNRTLVIGGWERQVFTQQAWYGVNAGSFLIRNSKRGLELLNEWASYGPRGDIRQLWGPVFSSQLTGRPAESEADDQAAIVWILLSRGDLWGPHVQLEHGYSLHAYWVTVVDRYEALAGAGRDSWPFVTHFVGCEICRFHASYDFDKCSRGIMRAYNFADNQILGLYGYEHASLSSLSLVQSGNNTERLIAQHSNGSVQLM